MFDDFYCWLMFVASREYLIVISFILQHRLTHRQNTQIHIHFRSVHDIAAKPEALIFISVRGNENIVRDEENENEKWDESCDKMWRWLYNTCKSNHPERQNKRIKRDRREIQLWIWFQMRMFLAKKYILTTESVIMANRQTHRILFVASYGYESRKIAHVICCHVFNADQIEFFSCIQLFFWESYCSIESCRCCCSE